MAKKGYLTPLVLTIGHAHLHTGRILHPRTGFIFLFLKKNANKLHLSTCIIKDGRSIMNCSKSSKYFEGVFGGKLKRNLQMGSYTN
jgi:hypothetical protein